MPSKLNSSSFQRGGAWSKNAPLIKRYFHDDVLKKAMRNMILDEGIRLDGRKTTEIRPIWCEVDYLPAAHGSGHLYPG